MSMNRFVFGNMNSAHYNVTLFEGQTENAPSLGYSAVNIPGKSGDIVMSTGKYPNIEHTYYGLIYKDYTQNISAFKSGLLSQVGYQRLEDTFHDDEFYLAYFDSVLDIEKSLDGTMGKFEIEFERKPQRFLKSGELVQTFTQSGAIYNPTMFDSRPLIRVYGAGTLGIGSDSVTITTVDTYVDIDCELMDAYKGTVLKNSDIELSGYDFPVLHQGSNGITLGSGITRVEITPRWWRL